MASAVEVTLAELRAQVRLELADSSVEPELADELIDTSIIEAVTQYTTQVPFQASATVAASGNEYTLPELAVDILRIRGSFIDTASTQFVGRAEPKDLYGVWPTGEEPVVYIPHYPSHGKYYLPREPLADFTLQYHARVYPPVVGSDDDSIELGQRGWGRWAIVTLACYFCFFPRASGRSYLEQFSGRPDINVGNPLREEAKEWLREYERTIKLFTQRMTI